MNININQIFMKTILFILVATLFLVSCGERISPFPPQKNNYAKQIGLANVDTTSEWVYNVCVYFNTGDSTKYLQTHTVEDTANIQGKSAFLIRVQSAYGVYYYKMRTDSTGTEIQRGAYINKYEYPSLNTFNLNTGGGCPIYTNILSLDSTVSVNGHSYSNTIVYYSAPQACSTDEAEVYYQFGVGLVGSVFTGNTATTRQYLVSYK